MNIQILTHKVDALELKDFANNWYPNFLKGCVDLENNKIAVGGEYHIESAQLLVKEGGIGQNIWGFNIRYQDDGIVIEYDSMVNIKPKINNGRVIVGEELKQKVKAVVLEFINF